MPSDATKAECADRVRRTKAPVLVAGATFGASPEFAALGRELGLERWPTYFAGRGGMLGAVHADVVAAAFGFFAPSLVGGAWHEASPVAPPPQIAAMDATVLAAWGRRALGEIGGIDRIADLAERVVDAADAAGLPLFAAWRAFPNPDDHPAARAALVINRLREHRGGLHLVAVRAAGLSPLEAILASGGEEKARANGWREPFPDVTDARRPRAVSEARTDELAGAAYLVLSESEVDELADGLERVRIQLQADSAR